MGHQAKVNDNFRYNGIEICTTYQQNEVNYELQFLDRSYKKTIDATSGTKEYNHRFQH